MSSVNVPDPDVLNQDRVKNTRARLLLLKQVTADLTCCEITSASCERVRQMLGLSSSSLLLQQVEDKITQIEARVKLCQAGQCHSKRLVGV